MIDMAHMRTQSIRTMAGLMVILVGVIPYGPSVAHAYGEDAGSGPVLTHVLIADIFDVGGLTCGPDQKATFKKDQQGNLVVVSCSDGSAPDGSASPAPAAPAPASAAGGAKIPTSKPEPPPSVGLQIAPSHPDCLANGNCSLDDIVETGASLANLLTTISGALFLLAFVYGGAMYLMSFGDKGRVTTGKNAMKTASIGMLIIMFAWTIVNYVVTSITGK